MNARIAVLSICLAAGWTTVFAGSRDTDRQVFSDPIVSYYAGPSDMQPLNDRSAAQIAAGGWNLGWANKVEDLDIYYRHGIRALYTIGVPNLDDPAQVKALDATIDQIRHHPALFGYHLVDEPSAGTFPQLGRVVAYLRKRDPNHIADINLLPTYASNGQLGTEGDTVTAYREYLRQYVETVKPDQLSYDHYHFKKNSDDTQYFLNLGMIREAALKAGVPFLNIIQACDSPSEGWRGPNEHEIRWLMNTSLAYGARGISHFRYDVGLCQDASTPNALYWPVTRMNRDFHAIGTELAGLKSVGAYHCGSVPSGATGLPKDSRFTVKSLPQEILLDCFGKPDHAPTHVVVVNLDYKKPVTTTLIGPGSLEVFHSPTKTWSNAAGGSRAELDLPPGGGILVRLKKKSFLHR